MDNISREFLRSFVSQVKCTVCGGGYDHHDVTIISRRGDRWFVSVSCRTCRTTGLVAAAVKDPVPIDKVSDLTPAEKHRFAGQHIKANDVLAMHYFLTDFDGDFRKLFGEDEQTT